ncbi:hypothetical protein BKA56DRAFT_581600 [Ilyonectria sp. MPI-CAGE-AT-0026]|nr:hypothetical protein BKA56DRAFT_581600 [Ilyonectria sp. MPI-CAGE-AT-0026]
MHLCLNAGVDVCLLILQTSVTADSSLLRIRWNKIPLDGHQTLLYSVPLRKSQFVLALVISNCFKSPTFIG